MNQMNLSTKSVCAIFIAAVLLGIPTIASAAVVPPETLSCKIFYIFGTTRDPKGKEDSQSIDVKLTKYEGGPNTNRYIANPVYTTVDGRFEIYMHAIQPLKGDTFFEYDAVGIYVQDKTTGTLVTPGSWPSGRKEDALKRQRVMLLYPNTPGDSLEVSCILH